MVVLPRGCRSSEVVLRDAKVDHRFSALEASQTVLVAIGAAADMNEAERHHRERLAPAVVLSFASELTHA